MTNEQKHMGIVASLGCVIHREFFGAKIPCEIHHIAEGTGQRSDFMVAGLCPECHRLGFSFHLNGKTFLGTYNLPTEYHLLLLVNKYRIIDHI